MSESSTLRDGLRGLKPIGELGPREAQDHHVSGVHDFLSQKRCSGWRLSSSNHVRDEAMQRPVDSMRQVRSLMIVGFWRSSTK